MICATELNNLLYQYLMVNVDHAEEYLKRAETAEVLYCEPHDREYFDFEKCPCCEKEEQDSILEIAHRKQTNRGGHF